MLNERRRHPRVPDSRKIVVACGATVFEARLTNASGFGALALAPPAGVAVGTPAHLRIPIATGGTLLAAGRVVRVDEPVHSVAFSFDRHISEFPVEAVPAAKRAGARDILLASAIAIVVGLAIGGALLLVR